MTDQEYVELMNAPDGKRINPLAWVAIVVALALVFLNAIAVMWGNP